MAATVLGSSASLTTDAPRPLFDTDLRGLFVDRRNDDVVTRDGQRFLVNATTDHDYSAPNTVVMNWTAHAAPH